MRLVVDTNVVVSALRSRRGASNALLVTVLQGNANWLCSVPLFFEYESVLKRPAFLLDTGYRMEQIDQFMRDIAASVEGVDLHFQWRPQLPDPNDEMVLETAVNGKADAIVTHNRKDFLPSASQFAVRVAEPNTILKEIA